MSVSQLRIVYEIRTPRDNSGGDSQRNEFTHHLCARMILCPSPYICGKIEFKPVKDRALQFSRQETLKSKTLSVILYGNGAPHILTFAANHVAEQVLRAMV